MKTNIKNGIALFVIVVGIGVAASVARTGLPKKVEAEFPGTVTIGNTSVAVKVADTPSEQEKGLSVLDTLSEGKGMLFVWGQPGYYSFWMKDMKFAIDMIWITADFKVLEVKEHVSPDSYPTVFTPADQAQYVLEVPDGFFANHNLKIGDEVVVTLPK